MRLEVSRRSDLAVRSLRILADADALVRGPELAARVSTSPGFLSQVLSPLVRAGWVRSVPGPHGGYSLSADLSSISVLAVIEAIEGLTDTGRCVLANRPCNEEGECALHAPWTRARAELLAELDRTSVADIS